MLIENIDVTNGFFFFFNSKNVWCNMSNQILIKKKF